MVFHINSTVHRSDNNGGHYSLNPSAELVGQMTRPYDIITHGSQTYFGVKFFPHSFSIFTRESIHDLRDQSIHLPEILLADIAPAIDALNENPAFESFTTLMESYFVGALARISVTDKTYSTVDQAVRRLFIQQGSSRIERLYRDLGVSERYLQNVFQRHVGLTPKQLFRMVRFQTCFQYLYDPGLSLTDIALQCGYYDHAHFTHEFNTLAGVTPSVFRTMQNPFNRFFLDKSNLAYLCNYKNQI